MGFRSVICAAVMVVLVPLGAAASDNTEFIKYALSDVRAWYVYETPDEIDWPTVYYLNEEFGCRVDLIGLLHDDTDELINTSLPDRHLFNRTLLVDSAGAVRWSQALGNDVTDRNPDLIIVGADTAATAVSSLLNFVQSYQPSSDNLFTLSKVYVRSDNGSTDRSKPAVHLNARALGNRYHERMSDEIPLLMPGYSLPDNRDRGISAYTLLDRRITASEPETDFFSGMMTFRLTSLIDSLFVDGPMKDRMLEEAINYQGHLTEAMAAVADDKIVADVLAAYRELLPVTRYRAHSTALQSIPSFERYLARLEERAETAILHAAGLYWEGRVVLRDSPHGPKLKFIASVSNAGTEPIELSSVRFQPYWEDRATVLQEQSVIIDPHQSFVREYLIDIEGGYLESDTPDSLTFVSTLVLGEIPFDMTNSLPISESLPLSIAFEPPFFFVDPSARTDVDRVVAALNWKAIITKPADYAGSVHLELNTPRGMFAGAYRQDIVLEAGTRREVVGIPFTLSRLFEFGRQQQTIELSADGITVAIDTGYIRAAACEMPSSLSIGFLPDSTGLLEDVLRMAGANHRALTERTLQLGELEGYDVIVIGSGSFKRYPDLRWYKDRLEEFIRNGGSIVLFGQPDEWPVGALPVSLVPGRKLLASDDIENLIRYANVLSKPYQIDQDALLSWFNPSRAASPAEIAPSERVLVTPDGAALLSVSRLGQGQLIYCGLPLFEMISDLNLEAIHLFSNLMNY